MMRRAIALARTLVLFVFAFASACSRAHAPAAPPPADARIRSLADRYLDGYFARNPDQVTVYGVPGRHHDKLPDNSLEALQAWHAREDQWLREAADIDPATAATGPLRATHAIVREALEGSTAGRVCR